MKRALHWVWAAWLLCFGPCALAAARGPDVGTGQVGQVDFADHELQVVHGNAYEVRTRWHFATPPQVGAPIPLRPPLPEGAVVASGDFTPLIDARGRVHALQPTSAYASTLTVQGPLPSLLAARRLPIPMPDDGGLHRVVISKELRFSPAAGLGLDNHMGIQVAQGISRTHRRALDQHFGGPHAHRKLGAMYTTANATGLPGTIASSATHRLHLTLVALLAFVLSVLGLWALHRRMQRKVREEEVDRYLAQELDHFDAALDDRGGSNAESSARLPASSRPR